MTKTEIKIEGMTCGHCAMSITNEIATIAGVTNVKVDHTAGNAIVESEGVTNEQLADAVSEAGYTAKEFVTLNA
jgi:copper chaperone CopZ